MTSIATPGCSPPGGGRVAGTPIIGTIYGVNAGRDFREVHNVTLPYSLPEYAELNVLNLESAG
jgi:hypothetical protein